MQQAQISVTLYEDLPSIMQFGELRLSGVRKLRTPLKLPVITGEEFELLRRFGEELTEEDRVRLVVEAMKRRGE